VLANEIEADRRALQQLMADLEVSTDQVKVVAAWLGEKVGRLKLNGELLHRSPLSSVVELEVLLLGVHGKRALWRTLLELAGTDARLDAERLAELCARAERQAEEIEQHRRAAATAALTG
jgi:hypothetical protein